MTIQGHSKLGLLSTSLYPKPGVFSTIAEKSAERSTLLPSVSLGTQAMNEAGITVFVTYAKQSGTPSLPLIIKHRLKSWPPFNWQETRIWVTAAGMCKAWGREVCAYSECWVRGALKDGRQSNPQKEASHRMEHIFCSSDLDDLHGYFHRHWQGQCRFFQLLE